MDKVRQYIGGGRDREEWKRRRENSKECRGRMGSRGIITLFDIISLYCSETSSGLEPTPGKHRRNAFTWATHLACRAPHLPSLPAALPCFCSLLRLAMYIFFTCVFFASSHPLSLPVALYLSRIMSCLSTSTILLFSIFLYFLHPFSFLLCTTFNILFYTTFNLFTFFYTFLHFFTPCLHFLHFYALFTPFLHPFYTSLHLHPFHTLFTLRFHFTHF